MVNNFINHVVFIGYIFLRPSVIFKVNINETRVRKALKTPQQKKRCAIRFADAVPF